MAGAEPISLVTLLIALAITLPRVLVAMLMLPFLSRSLFGGMLRGVTAFSLALIVVPLTYHQIAPLTIKPLALVFLLPKEVLVGAVIGWLTGIPFWIAASFGRLVDIQRGALVATMFTPLFRDPTSTLGGLLTQALTVLFFAGTGVTLFLGALYHSYAVWPVWGWAPAWRAGGEMALVAAFQSIFYWMLVLGAPALILVFMVDLLMGVLNRFVPELNVFFLSFPFKTMAGLFMIAIYATVIVETFSRTFFARPDWLLAPLRQILQ